MQSLVNVEKRFQGKNFDYQSRTKALLTFFSNKNEYSCKLFLQSQAGSPSSTCVSHASLFPNQVVVSVLGSMLDPGLAE